MQRKDWKIWRSIFIALFAVGILWAAVARSPSNSQRASSLSIEEMQQSLQQWLMHRQQTPPGLENQLRAEWQARVRSSRQPCLVP